MVHLFPENRDFASDIKSEQVRSTFPSALAGLIIHYYSFPSASADGIVEVQVFGGLQP